MATAKELEKEAKKLEKDGKTDEAKDKFDEAAKKYEDDGDTAEKQAETDKKAAKNLAANPAQHENAEALFRQAAKSLLDAKKAYFKAAEMHIKKSAVMQQLDGSKKGLADAAAETKKAVDDITKNAIPDIDKAGDDYASAAEISEKDAASMKANGESGYESEYMEAMHQREDAAAMYNMAALMWALLGTIFKNAKMKNEAKQAATDSKNEKTKVKQQRDLADKDFNDAQ